MATHDSKTIIKFADGTMVVGLINNNNETAYREEVRDLAVSKIKELIVDSRKRRIKHPPIHVDRAVVEPVESFKFLSVHITNNLSWSTHAKTVVKRARKCLFPFRSLKRFGMGPQILKKLYRCTIESIVAGCVTTWY